MDAQMQPSPVQSAAAIDNYDVNRWNEMTPEEKERVIELSRKIDVSDSQAVIQYGSLAQSEVSKFSDAILAIRAGFTSIMVDRSSLPFEQNVAEVSDLVRIAHSVGVSVESELGHVGMGESYDEDRDAGLTNVAEAAEYVARTGCDSLAVAIGTAHGVYKGTPKLDFERLAELNAAVNIPLVLHGGSGSGDENLVKCIQGGITKINIAADLFIAGEKNLKEDPRSAYFAFDKLADGYKAKLKYYMELFGETGMALKY